MNIVNVGYDSTNFYLLDIKNGKLLVDCGFPGTLPKLSAELKRKGCSIGEIKYFLPTHYHPDHAGLAQELTGHGIKLIALEEQAGGIPALTEFFKSKKYPYHEFHPGNTINLKCTDSRRFLAGLGLNGEILHTPGHSPDSVTLILDDGFAFTGDLKPVFTLSEDDKLSKESWDKINCHKIKRIYPGHGSS